MSTDIPPAMDHAVIKAVHGMEFRRCLRDRDIVGLMKLHNATAGPDNQFNLKETVYAFHMARAEAESIPLAERQYSDKWLRERGLGAFLPPKLSSIRHIKEAAYDYGIGSDRHF
jgi:hypothetical protein